MKTKLLTLEEADNLLPQVRQILNDLRAIRGKIQQMEKEKAVEELSWLEPDGSVSPKAQEGLARIQKEQQEQLAAFDRALERINRLGAQLKGLDEGLVDFFSNRGEELICLCWKEGEDRIRYWHDLESGFAGRRPIEELES